MNYLSVSDFSEKAGVSKQTVYDQIQPGKRLHPYVRKIRGKKMIRVDALSYYTAERAFVLGEIDNVPDPPEPEPVEDQDPFKTFLLERIERLDEQIRAKDEQLKAKDEQLKAKDELLERLAETMRADAVMLHSLQEQIVRLRDKSEDPEGQDSQEEQADQKTWEPAEAAQPSQEAQDPQDQDTGSAAPEQVTERPEQPEPVRTEPPRQEQPRGIRGFFSRLFG